jgi:ABC-type uncharacterized transport system permease subunit
MPSAYQSIHFCERIKYIHALIWQKKTKMVNLLTQMRHVWKNYPLVIYHNYGKSPFIVNFPKKNCYFPIVMLVYQRVYHEISDQVAVNL